MHTDLLQALQNYGLSEKEAKIYLTILEMGTTPVSVIARRSGVKRVTVYPILEELKKKWIVHESTKNEIKQYSVIWPDTLFWMFQQKYTDFQQNLPAFFSLAGKYGDRPQMQFFEGETAVRSMLYDYTDIWIKSLADCGDKTWRWYQDHRFVELYLDWLERYWGKKIPDERIYLLTNKAPIEDIVSEKTQKQNQRIVKFVPAWFCFTSTIRICGDYIVMIMAKEDKHYAFQINDTVFAANLREFFKMTRSMI